jgi:hypothetical protein
VKKPCKKDFMTTPKPFTSGCLVCGKSTRPYGSRGLCQAHYRQFADKLKSFATEEEAEEFEQRSIRLGWALPLTGGGRPKSWSPFDDIANEVRERHNEYESSPEDLAKFVDKKVAQRKATAPKKASDAKKKGTS